MISFFKSFLGSNPSEETNRLPTETLAQSSKINSKDQSSKTKYQDVVLDEQLNPLPGIINESCNCWANCIIQTLATVPCYISLIRDLLNKAEELSRHNENYKKIYKYVEHITRPIIDIQLLREDPSIKVSQINSQNFRIALRKLQKHFLETPEAMFISDKPHVQEDPAEGLIIINNIYDKFLEITTSELSCRIENISYTEITKYRFLRACDELKNCSKDEKTHYFLSAMNNGESKYSTIPENLQKIQPSTNNFLRLDVAKVKDQLIYLFQELKKIRNSNIDSKSQRIQSLKEDALSLFFSSHFFETRGEEIKAFDINTQELGIYKPDSKTIIITTPPKDLFITINKFENYHKKIQHSVQKINILGNVINAVEELPAPLLLQFTLPEDLIGQTSSYEVDSFTIHMGNSGVAGHYVCCQKINGNWFYFNDRIVRQIPSDQAEEYLQQAVFIHLSKLDHVDERFPRLRNTNKEKASMLHVEDLSDGQIPASFTSTAAAKINENESICQILTDLNYHIINEDYTSADRIFTSLETNLQNEFNKKFLYAFIIRNLKKGSILLEKEKTKICEKGREIFTHYPEYSIKFLKEDFQRKFNRIIKYNEIFKLELNIDTDTTESAIEKSSQITDQESIKKIFNGKTRQTIYMLLAYDQELKQLFHNASIASRESFFKILCDSRIIQESIDLYLQK